MTGAVTRGRITAARIRGGRTIADIQMMDGETRTRVEVMLPMGLTAVPRAGADVVVLEVGGRDHLVALLADDPALRVGSLAPGEIGIRDERGQQVTLTPDGVRITGALKVTIVSAANVEIAAPKLVVTGDVDVSGTLTLTGPGVNLNTHVHTGVEPGGSSTGGPT